MLRKLKLLFTAVIALTAFAALASSAQATNSFSIEPGGSISSPTQGRLSFASSAATIQCSLTLNGSLRHGGLILLGTALTMGAITEVTINRNSCEGGRVRAILIGGLNPTWWLQFEKLIESGGALGELIELPIAKVIKILNTAFELEAFGGFVNCLFSGTAQGEQLLTLVSHNAGTRQNVFTSGLVRASPRSVFTSRTGGLCPTSGTFSGTLSLTPQQTIWKRIP